MTTPPPEFQDAARAGRSKVAFSTSDGIQIEKVENISAVEAAGSYSFVHLKNGQRLLVCKTLRVLMEELSPQLPLFRIHRSHAVNLDLIKRYVRDIKGGCVVMEGGVEWKMASSRRTDFLQAVNRYFC